ncbi:MAG: beta-galactosidase, partial [Prevotella sp.]|nr:beta-galactosidase [Prevotella sp.]
MKRLAILSLLITLCINHYASGIGNDVMQRIYKEVRTPYKYGMVVAPADNYHKIDCPTVFRENGKWYMTYVVYDGKDGTDGRGYETWLAESDDLLTWHTKGRLLSFKESGWDMNQRGGFPALIDWTWGGSYKMETFKGRHWMTYIGGEGTGYEAVKAPLNIGMAWTEGDITQPHEWQSSDKPLLSINDKDVQWWEKLVQYKSTIYRDDAKTLGKRFIMFYNAGGINPANDMKAERIGIALSDNLKKWKRYEGNPVYSHEAKGIITGDAQIVKMDDLYVMFYFSAYNPKRNYNAFNTFSVSRDLIHWQDWTGADLIYPTKEYDEMFAHKSYVVKHDGVVYHFYCAVNNEGQRGIAVATSTPMGKSQVSFPAPETKGRRTITNLNNGWEARLLNSADNSFRSSGVKELRSSDNSMASNSSSLIPPLSSESPSLREGLGVGSSSTEKINLPHNFDDYYGYRQLRHGNLHGSAVYSKSFDAEKKSGKRYFLQLEGVGTYATITLNGTTYPKELVGRTVFTLDITDALRNGRNDIKIDVDHPAMQTESPWVCGGCSSEWGFSEGSQPLGIFRPVSLIETDEVRIEPFGVHIWHNDRADSVFINTEVHNYSTATATIDVVNKFMLSSGKQVFRLVENVTVAPGETKIVHQRAAVSDP